MTDEIAIEDIINIWISMEKYALELMKTDKKAANDIIKTHNKFMRITINNIKMSILNNTKGKENE